VEPVFLNLLAMCAANFGGANYFDALKLLSGAIGFFQINAVLDHHNCPELVDRAERISFEIENLERNTPGGYGFGGGDTFSAAAKPLAIRFACSSSTSNSWAAAARCKSNTPQALASLGIDI